MNLRAQMELTAYGTSEGVEKEWDTRGRKSGRNIGNPGAAWWHHSIEGDARKYHIYEGAGTQGGKWMVKESGGAVNNRDIKIFNSLKEAQDHVHASQP